MLSILSSHRITLLKMDSDTLKVILSNTSPVGETKAVLTTLEKSSTTQKN